MSHDWSDRYNPKTVGQNGQLDIPRLPPRSSSVDASSRRYLDVDAPEQRRKHHHLDDTVDEDRAVKKSRVDGEELIDGDNDAAWHAHMPGSSRRGSLQVPKRGSKRHANAEEGDSWEMSQDKRARKGSAAYPEDENDAEDVIDFDMDRDASDAEPARARGTKREWEEIDSAADGATYDTDDSHRPRPTRKRRTARREDHEVNMSSRGRKRERSQDRSSPSDEDQKSDAQGTRHKRGRPCEESEGDVDVVPTDASDSEDQPEIADDPACGGRKIGDTWEVNGQSFKVGLDGRRLRHALVRQSRCKFPMVCFFCVLA